jgi:cation:H+ antiporter
LFIDGYNYIDGIIFAVMFVAYLAMALFEMKAEKSKTKSTDFVHSSVDHEIVEVKEEHNPSNQFDKQMLKASLAFLAGTVGIVVGAEPFIHSLVGFSTEIGISAVILAIIISPIAGEMPEKISMMVLARKGATGAAIAVANVIGSKILNNTLLLAVAVFGAMYHGGFYTSISLNNLLAYQVVLVTVVTIIALIPMFKKEIGLKVGVMLAGMYIISLFVQFLLPHETSETH